MASNPENGRLTVLMKLQEALDEEPILEEQMLALMHRFADRFTDRRVEINNLMVLHDHPLIDYGKTSLSSTSLHPVGVISMELAKGSILIERDEKEKFIRFLFTFRCLVHRKAGEK
ncbi:hypothetical protein Tco_0397528 [Tanacetum coccineum]